MAEQQTITIDGVEYRVDDLSEDAKNQVANLRVCDRRLQELQADLVITRTARAAYAAALQKALPSSAVAAAPGEPEGTEATVTEAGDVTLSGEGDSTLDS